MTSSWPAAARPAPGIRVVGVAALVAVCTLLVTGSLPAPVAAGLVGAGLLGATLVCAVLVLRRAGRTGNAVAWRLYGLSLLVGCAGSGVVQVLSESSRAAVVASLPGQVLGAAALLAMCDPGVLRAQWATVASALGLYVVAAQLGLHTGLQALAASSVHVPALDGATSLLLAGGAAIVTGSALAVFTAQNAVTRPRGAALLGAQGSWSVVALTAQLTPRDLGSPLQALTVLAGFAALALVLRAVRLDDGASSGRPVSAAAEAPTARAAVVALLPHAAALVAGCLLLVTTAVTGEMDPASLTLGIVGLALLLVHQYVAWRAHTSLGEHLRRSESRFRTLVRGNVDPVLVLDDQLRISWVSPTIEDLLGLDPADVVGSPLALAVHPDDASWLLETLRAPAAASADASDTTVTARLRHRDGRWRLIRARVRDLRGDPDVAALVLYARDVTDTGSVPRERVLATTTEDPASGLPNGTALARRLHPDARTTGGPTADQGAMVLVGVPGLTDDPPVVLATVLTAVSRVLRTGDWLARPAPDQFAVLVEGTVADAEVVAARLVGALDRLPPAAGHDLRRCGAGVVTLVPDVPGGELLSRAERALEGALGSPTEAGRVARWSTTERARNDRRDLLRADLGRALTEGQLRLVYQPVVDVALHRTASVEALLRWEHPTFGAVSPAEFIPLAEAGHLIVELGCFVLRQATADIAALADSRVGVAVNVSTRHLVGGTLVDDVMAALAASGLAPTRLVVEVTESVLIEDRHVIADLQALRDHGIRIAIDDFGTGWSSLAYLAGLPVDVLKMDKQFLADVETDPQRRALCRVVLDLGTSLGLPVIVEGVETDTELHLVRAMGHRYVQGFVLCRPVELDELPVRLARLDTATQEVPA